MDDILAAQMILVEEAASRLYRLTKLMCRGCAELLPSCEGPWDHSGECPAKPIHAVLSHLNDVQRQHFNMYNPDKTPDSEWTQRWLVPPEEQR